jgi:hypothetical protein
MDYIVMGLLLGMLGVVWVLASLNLEYEEDMPTWAELYDIIMEEIEDEPLP